MTTTPKGLSDQPDLFSALRACRAAPEALENLLAASPPTVAARLRTLDAELLRAVLRAGRGEPAIPNAAPVVNHLRGLAPAPMFHPMPTPTTAMALPTTGALPGMPAFSDRTFDTWFAAQGKTHGIGLYGENRTVYATPQFADAASPERRTIHLGIDIFSVAGTAVHAPLDGTVHVLTYNQDPLDYGHTLILEHRLADTSFYTLYGHLGGSLTRLLSPGAKVVAGQHIADLGDWHENGGWAPHLHFQIITDMLDQTGGNFFGVGHAGLWDIWQQISPNPNLLLRLPEEVFRL